MKSWNRIEDAAATAQPARIPLRSHALSATFVILVVLAALDTIFPNLKWALPVSEDTSVFEESTTIPGYGFDWSKINPSEDLEFSKCYYEFECARLSVPLDPLRGNHPTKSVSIAIVKFPARVPVDDPRYGGPILVNPGGPGGSGTLFVQLVAQQLQVIVDADEYPNVPSDGKYYDIIGFDPRGIGFTEPAASCMPDTPSEWSWALRVATEGMLGSSDAALGRLWSMAHAFGTSCKQAADAQDEPDIKEYMSTAYVAHDMLDIVERHAEYVQKELRALTTNHKAKLDTQDTKLDYWGFSYGTYLGSTFASMFPDRVGHLVLDAVVSAYDYSHSLGNGSLTDTEKVMDSFFTWCHTTGPEECALAGANATIPDIEKRFNNIVGSLYHNPIPLFASEVPEILTWSDVKILIFSSLYTPRFVFPLLSTILAAVEDRQGTILDDLGRAFRPIHTYSCVVDAGAPSIPYLGTPTTAVLCGDGIDQSRKSMDDFAEYWHLLDDIAPSGGSYWAMLLMRCTAWKIRANYSFKGPFGGKTSNPILFVSNTADPVTPLRSGRLMQSMFENSSILVQDSAGHCSVSTPTPCTVAFIRAYYQTGALPPPNTVCVPPLTAYSLNSTDPKSPFFDPSLGTTNMVSTDIDKLDTSQRRLLEVGQKLQRMVAESNDFAFQNIMGTPRAGRVMKLAFDLL